MNQWVQFENFVKGPVTSGQICKIYGIPVEWLTSFPSFDPESQYLQGSFALLEGKSWIRFIVAASSKSLDEEVKLLKGRPYWEQSLSFRLNWQSGEQSMKLNNMANHRWVFAIQEGGTGLTYILGKPPVGAEVQVTYSNKQGTITDIKASFKAIHRLPIYVGTTPVDPDPEGDFAGADFRFEDFFV